MSPLPSCQLCLPRWCTLHTSLWLNCIRTKAPWPLVITPDISYPGNSCSDWHMSLERASVCILHCLDLLSVKIHWSYWSSFSLALVWLKGWLNPGMTALLIVSIKYGVPGTWSFLLYSGQLLNSPPRHMRRVLILGKEEGQPHAGKN